MSNPFALGAVIAAAIVTFIVLVLIVASLIAGNHRTDNWNDYRQHCAEAKGHIYMPTNIAWCLTDDGRIIEVYP